jgi:Tfp pilus assembly protein PilX
MRSTHAARRSSQRGATLIVALILLLIFILFGVGAINSGVVSLRIARNAQVSAEAQAAAQLLIDATVSDLANFTAPASRTLDVDATGGGTQYSVVMSKPQCIHSRAAPGYSYLISNLAPQDTTWRIQASATDTSFGATGVSVAITQGVKVRLPNSVDCP